MERLMQITPDAQGFATLPDAFAWTYLKDNFVRSVQGQKIDDQFHEIYDWCEENFGPSARVEKYDEDGDPIFGPIVINNTGVWIALCGTFFFRTDAHAVLFKFRWG